MLDIHIDWDGPFSLGEVLSLNSFEDYGLYQYYGDHPVYGAGVLLYVGKASAQTFGNRLAQHNWHRWVPSPTEIYVGRVCAEMSLERRVWERLVDLAEKIEIYAHSPAFNSSNLNRIGHQEGDARVLNWGKRKSLLPEVSISRWEGGRTVGHDRPKTLIPCSSAAEVNNPLKPRPESNAMLCDLLDGGAG